MENQTHVVVDIECFSNNVIKEVAVCTQFYCIGLSLKPPSALDKVSQNHTKQNEWLTRKLHGIEWSSGNVFYHNLENLWRSFKYKNAVYYAKGLPKCKLLESLLEETFINLEDMACPTFKQLVQKSNSAFYTPVVCDSYPNIHGTTPFQHCAQHKARI